MKLKLKKNDGTIVNSNERLLSITEIHKETLSYYYYKIKDTLSTSSTALLNSYNSSIVPTILSKRTLTESKLPGINFNDIKYTDIVKPVNFSGKYINYASDIIISSNEMIANIEFTLNNLIIAINTFIDDYNEGTLDNIYGYTYFKDAFNISNNNLNFISNYFPYTDGVTKTDVGNLLNSLNDVSPIYNYIISLDNILNSSLFQEINILVTEILNIIDSLIEQNNSLTESVKSINAENELINALYIATKEIDVIRYIYNNTVSFYTCFNELTKFLRTKG